MLKKAEARPFAEYDPVRVHPTVAPPRDNFQSFVLISPLSKALWFARLGSPLKACLSSFAYLLKSVPLGHWDVGPFDT